MLFVVDLDIVTFEKRHRMGINRRLVSRMDFIMENPKHHPRYQKDIERDAAKRKRKR